MKNLIITIIIINGWKMCFKFNFIAIFLILANFTAFLDHTKENADVSKFDGCFQVNFYVYRKYMPEAFSTPNLVALTITSQELDGGGGGLFCPPTKIVLLNSPTTIGLSQCYFHPYLFQQSMIPKKMVDLISHNA